MPLSSWPGTVEVLAFHSFFCFRSLSASTPFFFFFFYRASRQDRVRAGVVSFVLLVRCLGHFVEISSHLFVPDRASAPLKRDCPLRRKLAAVRLSPVARPPWLALHWLSLLFPLTFGIIISPSRTFGFLGALQARSLMSPDPQSLSDSLYPACSHGFPQPPSPSSDCKLQPPKQVRQLQFCPSSPPSARPFKEVPPDSPHASCLCPATQPFLVSFFFTP